MHPVLDKALQNLDKAKATGGQHVQACCPTHDDKNPSLSLTEKDGKILVHCFAGCSNDDVIRALKDKGVDIFESSSVKEEGYYSSVKKGTAEPKFSEFFNHNEPSKIWTYFDETGEYVLGYICRWESDKGKEIRPITPWRDNEGKTHWKSKAFPEPRPLYGLELLNQFPDRPVLIVEGEKAADAARANNDFKNYVVVTWPGGSKATSKVNWRPIYNRDVLIWPDNDDPGMKAAKNIKAILEKGEI